MKGWVSGRSGGYKQPGIFTIWRYIPSKSLKLSLTMDLKVSGSSLTQGMKGFSYFWDLFSGVTQACLRPPSDGVGRGVGMQKKY